MAAKQDQDTIDHAVELMASLKALREDDCICDFIVNVGNDSFSVHRSVLAACSRYFKAMFSHDMKEATEGSVDMKGLSPDAVKACIGYMYTGKAGLTLQNVTDILHASNFLQMDKLYSKCFKLLSSNITPGSCLWVKRLAEMYGNQALIANAEKYVVDNFASVSSTPAFKNIHWSRFLRYIGEVKADYVVLWEAVIAWTKHDVEWRKEKLPTLLQAIKLQQSPPQFLLQTAWAEPLVDSSEKCKNLITQAAFSRPDLFEGNITIDSYFLLKSMASQYKPANAKKVLAYADEFLMAHFEGIAGTPELTRLAKEDIIMLLRSEKTNCYSETVKWNATMKWLKYDHRRKEELLEFMKLIKFQNMSPEFIKNNVRSEKMVAESPGCKDLLLDALLLRPSLKQRTTTSPPTGAEQPTGIAIFDEEKSEVIFFDISNKQWTKLSRLQEKDIIGMVNVAGSLYLVSQRFIMQMQRDKTWKIVAKNPDSTQEAYGSPVLAYRGVIYFLRCHQTLRYHPQSNRWLETFGGTGLYEVACASLHGNIYTFGGLCQPETVQMMDTNVQEWLTLASAKCVHQRGSSDSLPGKIIYIVWDSPSRLAHRYDPITGVWRQLASMNHVREEAVVCTVNNKLYAIGGAVDQKGGKLTPNSIEVFNEELNKWTIFAQLPRIGGKLYACAY